MLIDPGGLLNGDRIAACSDDAQLHFPRLMAASNGFGRLELSYANLIKTVYAHFTVKPTKAQLEGWFAEYKNHFLLFPYRTDLGSIWGQWDVPAKMLPRYKKSEDNRSPAPPEEAFTAFRKTYTDTKHCSEDSLNISEDFGNVLNASEHFGTFPLGIGIGVGTGIGIGEEQKQKHVPSAPSSLIEEQASFLEAWNTNCGTLPKILKLTSRRAKLLSKSTKAGVTIEQFILAVQTAARTPFLRGENDRRWKCDFDFLLNEDHFQKCLEGGYGPVDKPKKIYRDITEEPEAALFLVGGLSA